MKNNENNNGAVVVMGSLDRSSMHQKSKQRVMSRFSNTQFDKSQRRGLGNHAAVHQEEQSVNNEDDIVGEDDGQEEKELLAEVQDANERFSGHTQVKRKNNNQWGVFTSRPFTKGSTVISSSLLAKPNNTTSCSHSIQIGWEKHILMALPARFLNHCCDPNVCVGRVANEGGSYDFVALCDIEAGEEVRFDYETTEYEIGAFSECHCGAVNCRGIIRGFRHNANVILTKYGAKNVSGYLVRGR